MWQHVFKQDEGTSGCPNDVCVCLHRCVYSTWICFIVPVRLTTILLFSPGARISTFTQADLASRSIQYVHTSEEEKHADQFSFTVSDGTNEVNEGVNAQSKGL